MKKPSDIRIAANFCTSRIEYDDNPERWEVFAEESLRTKIAHILQRDRSETIKIGDMVEKRLELYVATPDVFWKIVREEAEKIVY